MITLDPLEKNFLEALFRGISDRFLIRELVRRERFGQVRGNVIIDDRCLKDEGKAGYEKYMNERLAMQVGLALLKAGERGYVVSEHPNPGNSYRPYDQKMRCADVVVLRGPPTSFEPDNDGTQHAKPIDARQTGHDDLRVEDRGISIRDL